MFRNLIELISPEYKIFYDRLILDLPINQFSKDPTFHPHFALKFKNSDPALYMKVANRNNTSNIKKIIIFHKKLLTGRILERKNLICFSDKMLLNELEVLRSINFNNFAKTMPPITSSDISQNPKKVSKLFTLDGHKWFVAIQITKPVEYMSNKISLDRALSRSRRLFTVRKWAILNESGKSFFISLFLGYTLEQKIKYKSLNDTQIKKILNVLIDAKDKLGSSDLFWKEFAPRNMFVSEVTRITFADFENLYVKSQLAKSELNYLEELTSVGFADIFDFKLMQRVIGKKSNIGQNILVSADDIERSFYNRKRISYLQRKKLFDITRKFEKKHSKDGHTVYGHRIGRFLTDFFDVGIEVKLLKIINKLKSAELFILLSTLQFFVNLDMETLLRDLYLEGRKKTSRLYSVEFIERYSYRWMEKHKSDGLEFIYRFEKNYKDILAKANYLLQ